MNPNSYVQSMVTGTRFMDMDASKKFGLIRFLGLLGIKTAEYYPVPHGSVMFFKDKVELFDGRRWVKIA